MCIRDRDNTEPDFDVTSNLINVPVAFNDVKIWKTKDKKIGQFPMGPNQDTKWGDDREQFINTILAPTYMRGTRTVYNRGEYV